MMSIKDLFAELSKLDIRLRVSECALHFRAPEPPRTETERLSVKAGSIHKKHNN